MLVLPLADPAFRLFFLLGNMSASDTGPFWDENGLAARLAMEAGATRFNMCVVGCAEATCVRFSPSDGSCLQKGYNNGCTTLLPGAASHKQGCAHPGSVTCVPAVCFNQLPVLRVGCAQTPTAANLTSPAYGTCDIRNGPNLSPPPVLGATSFGGYVWNGTPLLTGYQSTLMQTKTAQNPLTQILMVKAWTPSFNASATTTSGTMLG